MENMQEQETESEPLQRLARTALEQATDDEFNEQVHDRLGLLGTPLDYANSWDATGFLLGHMQRIGMLVTMRLTADSLNVSDVFDHDSLANEARPQKAIAISFMLHPDTGVAVEVDGDDDGAMDTSMTTEELAVREEFRRTLRVGYGSLNLDHEPHRRAFDAFVATLPKVGEDTWLYGWRSIKLARVPSGNWYVDNLYRL